MKNNLVFIAILISNMLLAQAPQRLSYQAVIRNNTNNLVSNTPVKMRISILQGGSNGTAVYSELHNPTTNANGLVSIEIGNGTTPTGNFSSINWSKSIYFIKTETDPTNGNNFTITGITQLLSVPYALNAKSADDGINRVSGSGDTLVLNSGKTFIIPGLSAANNTTPSFGTLTDFDNNTYRTIQIGTQTWMADNLRVTKFRNGTAIPNITDSVQWQNTTNGAWCYYNNNASFNSTYGKLYNYYVIENSNNICPTGWHVATRQDWYNLLVYLGGGDIAGSKMKSAGTQFWLNPNFGATNSSGFSGLPGGNRSSDGFQRNFDYMGLEGYWWSLSDSPDTAETYYLLFDYGFLNSTDYPKNNGHSIRCVKD